MAQKAGLFRYTLAENFVRRLQQEPGMETVSEISISAEASKSW